MTDSSTRPDNPLAGDALLIAQDLRKGRLLQALAVMRIALWVLIVHQAVFELWNELPPLLALLAIAYGLSYGARRMATDLIVTLMLTSAAIVSSYFIWRNLGLRDEALIALPAILAFSTILGSARLSAGLLVFMLANILAVGYVNEAGIMIHRTLPSSLGAAMVICILLVLTSYSVWLLSRDLKQTLTLLTEENRRVRLSERRVTRLLHHDVLTGLPNRALARDRFESAVIRAKRSQCTGYLMFVDLDDFKHINDSMGHHAGDELLLQISHRFRLSLRESDSVCRWGGDEFVVIVEEIDEPAQARALVQKLLDAVATPVTVNGTWLTITGSAGLARFPDQADTFETICSNADIAMYKAKEAGKNQIRFYENAMSEATRHAFNLSSDLKQAIRNEELWVAFQPKVNLRDQRLVGLEALMRWQHPVLGAVPPDQFIPIAESSGIIEELGTWILREACEAAARLSAAGFGAVRISVNVSPIQLRSADFVRTVKNALDGARLSGSRLELELTESSFVEYSPMLSRHIDSLCKAGVHFSIDDFGTGYSNLGYLQNLDIQTIKIDRSFVQGLVRNKNDRAIVDAIIRMAGSLALEVVAEGIEDCATAELLVALGCNSGQGFLWSKPLPMQELLPRLGQWSSMPRGRTMPAMA